MSVISYGEMIFGARKLSQKKIWQLFEGSGILQKGRIVVNTFIKYTGLGRNSTIKNRVF